MYTWKNTPKPDLGQIKRALNINSTDMSKWTNDELAYRMNAEWIALNIRYGRTGKEA